LVGTNSWITRDALIGGGLWLSWNGAARTALLQQGSINSWYEARCATGLGPLGRLRTVCDTAQGTGRGTGSCVQLPVQVGQQYGFLERNGEPGSTSKAKKPEPSRTWGHACLVRNHFVQQYVSIHGKPLCAGRSVDNLLQCIHPCAIVPYYIVLRRGIQWQL
jgi:hypothetical protein